MNASKIVEMEVAAVEKITKKFLERLEDFKEEIRANVFKYENLKLAVSELIKNLDTVSINPPNDKDWQAFSKIINHRILMGSEGFMKFKMGSFEGDYVISLDISPDEEERGDENE